MQEKFNLTGMTCASCQTHVIKAVEKLDGISDVNVNLLTNSMTVNIDKDKISNLDIISAVEKAGYGANLVNEAKTIKKENIAKINAEKEINDLKNRLIVSIIFSIPLMYVSMGSMVGLPLFKFMEGIEGSLSFVLTQFLLVLPIIYVNRSYYIRGFKSLFNKNPNMDSLIAIGSSSALVYGIFALYMISYGLGFERYEIVQKYHMDVYFESAGMILTLITVGKYFEAKSKGKTSEALEKLMDIAPKMAIVEKDGIQKEVLIEEVMVEDIVIIKPGSSIPVDGVIIEGSTSIDESAITGESIPVEKNIGSKVIQATINKTGFVKVKATSVGEDTIFSKILKLVEEAGASKAPIAKLADKVSGIFVPIVIIIAIITAIVWLLSNETFEFALSSAIAVLVISCPCALGLATPVAIMVGTGKGAENGILIKSGEALETAHNINTVILDKTGTITEGKPKVTDVINIDIEKEELLKIAKSLEIKSEHPLAEAIIEHCKDIDVLETKNFDSLSGKGIQAEINNTSYIVGNERLMKENNTNISEHINIINDLSNQGKTALLFARNNKLIGIIAVADTIKSNSKKAIEKLKEMGIETIMLTGDNQKTANGIARDLSLDKVIAEVLPSDKESVVLNIQKENKIVAMVGDGINDAPALVRSDVGIAIGSGTDVAVESADIVLMRNDLMDVVNAIKLSKATITNIKQNLFWAFFYNTLGIPLAAGVLYPNFGLRLSPMFGAFAMGFSSVFVVSNALRLKLFKIEREEIKMIKKEIIIEGMMCQMCVKHVKNALENIGLEVEVNLEKNNAIVSSTKEIRNDVIIKTIEEAGYKVVDINSN